MMKKLLMCALSLVLFACPASADVPVTGVTLDEQSITIELEGVRDLPVMFLHENVAPDNATNTNVIWSSSNEAVATVNQFGYVWGVSPGSADITVTTEDGGFTAVCNVNVVAGDIQKTTIHNSASKSEAAAKAPGFSEDDFEVVDGQVTVKKSIVETVAKELLGINDIEVSLLPWFEAKIDLSGQNGKIACVEYTELDKSTFKVDPEALPWYVAEEILLLNIISPEAGEFMKLVVSADDHGDGKFWVPSFRTVDKFPFDEHLFVFQEFIKDGGKYDLDKTENGSVVGQIAFIGKAEPQEEDGGGCNTGLGSAALLFIGLALLTICRKCNL